jgi:hypothetical protein
LFNESEITAAESLAGFVELEQSSEEVGHHRGACSMRDIRGGGPDYDFIANDPIGYFRQEPSRLLAVAGIAITGGLVTLGFYRLPPRAQRQVGMFGLAAAASAAAAAIGYFVFAFFSIAPIISRYGGSTRPLLLMLLPVWFMLLAISAGCGYACWRVWKSGVLRR